MVHHNNNFMLQFTNNKKEKEKNVKFFCFFFVNVYKLTTHINQRLEKLYDKKEEK